MNTDQRWRVLVYDTNGRLVETINDVSYGYAETVSARKIQSSKVGSVYVKPQPNHGNGRFR